MTNNTAASRLYPYQQRDSERLLNSLTANPTQRLLYQLPTGAGKTVIFAELVRSFLATMGGQALVLTHRIELSRQTNLALRKAGVSCKIIDSSTRRIRQSVYQSFVAMVETLHNRLEERLFNPSKVTLLIIDEAHHNAFQKLLPLFPAARIVGVTATPLSADPALPLNQSYDQLLVGESIAELVKGGYLARPVTTRFDVELASLKQGDGGDFTTGSSDDLYGSPEMLSLLLQACRQVAPNRKTLIFNHGVVTSRKVEEFLSSHGLPVRHLDNHATAEQRQELLDWFRKTRNAILTSVSLLTTGFDEPSIRSIILYRATTSLTLYHQMIGRGSRALAGKRRFQLIDLGGNVERFGEWEAPMDWERIFRNPDEYLAGIYSTGSNRKVADHAALRSQFPATTSFAFDMQGACREAVAQGRKLHWALQQSIRQHASMCIENASSIAMAIDLVSALGSDIESRVRIYCKCRGQVTKNYREWLQQDYSERLTTLVTKWMKRTGAAQLKSVA